MCVLRWRWIGHVTRQEASIAKTAMHWTPEGKRKRGRPKMGDGKDLGGHQVHGKGSPDVEGTRCCPTCLLA